jgi:hypothetical protein
MFECRMRQNASMSWLDNPGRPTRDHGFPVEKLYASERPSENSENNVLLGALRKSDRRSPQSADSTHLASG